MLSMSNESLLTALGTFLVTWGAMKAKIHHIEKRTDALEIHRNTLHDNYVNYSHFNEVLNSVRDNYKDLRDDVKKVLVLLSER